MAGDLSQGGTASKLAVRGELFIEGFSLPCFYTPWYKLPGGIHIILLHCVRRRGTTAGPLELGAVKSYAQIYLQARLSEVSRQ